VGPPERIVALSAFWVGLLYDSAALDGAWELVKSWSAAERERLRADVPRHALRASIGGRSVQEIARDALALARAGLKARGFTNGAGEDETRYLDPLDGIAASGRTPAEGLLELYEGRWNRSVEPAFTECVF
jgi:glutamate--cysteine ligase